ncbi:alpha-xylosidase [Microlunatus endophyticus]|uniref:alpha-D-xyloside xylohydrolase n=1 Tax=Microlunatus endophyticus TaxID=1716077 RepID=A0A917S7J5_9ACTN|nr:alpha-xylosidase [Microlunatus endophyticus]GGL62544.1 alpha-xylosidase [Microlunatus endophyticus]
MKFTDGYWQTLPGVEILKARDIEQITDDADGLTVYAATAPLTGRGATLNRPVIATTLSSPAPDVIGVTIEHFTGGRDRGPDFMINTTATRPQVDRADDRVSFRSGALRAEIPTAGPWRLDFIGDDQLLTSSTADSIGVITDDEDRHFVREQLTIGVGEHVYGLGERFGAFIKNGQAVDIWNADGGTNTEQAYKNVPFYLTDGGYGVFVAHPERVSFEIGTEVTSRTQFSVEGQRLTYYLIYGPTPKQILSKYTALTGRPAAVPDWSYGLWLSTSFTTGYDEQTVSSFIDGMAGRDIPLSVFHFDCFWMRQFHWCDFVWDPAMFPDPEAMLDRLKAKGVRICVWINPYIAQRSALFAEGEQLGYLVRTTDGGVWQTDLWQAGMGLVDFTNPDAYAWYAGKLKAVLDQGVDCFKTDFGERIPTDGVTWHDGSDPQRMHNYYAQLYNQCVFDLLRRERGDGEAVLFARSATAGGQQFPVHWGGDCESTFTAMAESLRGGLSLALSGFGYWSHDIGGFEGTPDPAIFKRWVAFGLLSSHSRLHGSSSYRVPWAFDDEAVEVTRTFARLKMRLLGYLSELGRIAHTEGIPVMRPMLLEFPEDRTAVAVDTQFLLGDRLLVAPIFRADGRATFYVPDGTWTHLLTGKQLSGPYWYTETYDFGSLPLFVRPGTVLPWGTRDDGPEYDHADGVTLRAFEVDRGTEIAVRVGDASYVVRRSGNTLTATAEGTDKPWRLQVGDRIAAAVDNRAELPVS